MMFSSVTGSIDASLLSSQKELVQETIALEEVIDTASMTTEEYVRHYFSDIPVMIDVARCESHFTHYNEYGEVLKGRAVSTDRGVMQINEYYHLDTANKLGINIYSLEGNLAYARYLYETQGTRPWRPSAKCWGKWHPEHYELAMR